MSEKHCSRCDRVLPISEFYPDASRKSGFASSCKECRRTLARARYRNDPEPAKRQRREYWEQNRSRLIPKERERHQRNKETRNAGKRRHYQENRARINAYDRARNPLRREAVRNRRLQKSYGISLDDYNRMVAEQNNQCAICGGAPRGYGKNDNVLHVDHCHKTGKVRGLLCSNCNLVLGGINDSIDLLRNAITYLEQHISTD